MERLAAIWHTEYLVANPLFLYPSMAIICFPSPKVNCELLVLVCLHLTLAKELILASGSREARSQRREFCIDLLFNNDLYLRCVIVTIGIFRKLEVVIKLEASCY